MRPTPINKKPASTSHVIWRRSLYSTSWNLKASATTRWSGAASISTARWRALLKSENPDFLPSAAALLLIQLDLLPASRVMDEHAHLCGVLFRSGIPAGDLVRTRLEKVGDVFEGPAAALRLHSEVHLVTAGVNRFLFYPVARKRHKTLHVVVNDDFLFVAPQPVRIFFQ